MNIVNDKDRFHSKKEKPLQIQGNFYILKYLKQIKQGVRKPSWKQFPKFYKKMRKPNFQILLIKIQNSISRRIKRRSKKERRNVRNDLDEDLNYKQNQDHIDIIIMMDNKQKGTKINDYLMKQNKLNCIIPSWITLDAQNKLKTFNPITKQQPSKEKRKSMISKTSSQIMMHTNNRRKLTEPDQRKSMDLLKIRYSQLRTDKDQIKRVTKNKKSEPLIRYGPSLNKSNEFYNLLKKISLSQDRQKIFPPALSTLKVLKHKPQTNVRKNIKESKKIEVKKNKKYTELSAKQIMEQDDQKYDNIFQKTLQKMRTNKKKVPLQKAK